MPRFRSHRLAARGLAAACLIGAAGDACAELDLTLRRGTGESLVLGWASAPDRQYQVYASDDLERARPAWDPVGEWLAGDGGTLAVELSEASARQRFFFLEERTEFRIDSASAGYTRPGAAWAYRVDDSREGDSPFEATFTVLGPVTYEERDAIEVRAEKAGGEWYQTLYLREDAAGGVYQIGGDSPDGGGRGEGPYLYTPDVPLLLDRFTPGAVVDNDYRHSEFGNVDGTVTHEIVRGLELSTGLRFDTAIKVTRDERYSIKDIITVQVRSVTRDWYVEGVGLVKKVSDVDVSVDGYDVDLSLELKELPAD